MKKLEIKVTIVTSDDPEDVKENNFQQGIKYAICVLKKIKEERDIQK